MATKFIQDGSVHTMKDFTPYPRYVLRSGMLSPNATAGYLWFISHEPEYDIRKLALLRAFPKLGEAKYRTMMAELRWFDLAQLYKDHDERGRFTQTYLIRWPTPDEVQEWKPYPPNTKKRKEDTK